MRHSWSVKFISTILCAALVLPLAEGLTARADEPAIPEEAVVVDPTEQTLVEDGAATYVEEGPATDPAEETPAVEEPTDTSTAEPTDGATAGTTDTSTTKPTDETTAGSTDEEASNESTTRSTDEATTAAGEIVDNDQTSEEQFGTLIDEATKEETDEELAGEEEIMLLADETDIDVQADAALPTYKYAVQIYGINVDTVWNDTDGDGVVDDNELTTGGLTFGPATGKDYTKAANVVSHTPSNGQTADGHAYRCIHNDEWGSVDEENTILYWNNVDPEVYSECLTKGCTHSVELTLTSDNSESTYDSNGQLGTHTFYSGVDYTNVTGDGPGVLVDEIARSNQRYSAKPAYKSVTWVDSKIRAVLNGKQTETSDESWDKGDFTADTNSVLSAFPSELQSAIGKKQVKYASDYTSLSSEAAICYDQLWLFSAVELYGTTKCGIWSTNNNTINNLTNSWIYPNEGTQYARTKTLSYYYNMAVYAFDKDSKSSSLANASWWSRSRATGSSTAKSFMVGYSGNPSTVIVEQTDSIGLSPGFVLSRPSLYTEPEPTTYKYAVQIYGIGVDQVLNEDGTTSTGGLTFGPAIGADYTSTYKSHIESSEAGEKRCIHYDSWERIIEENQKDPTVYSDCLNAGCTKTVELTMTADNSESAQDNSSKVYINSSSAMTLSGDGPGILVDIIQTEARKYADIGDANLTWANSQIRAALNGTQTETDSTYGGEKYTVDNSILSAFPEQLRNAIGKKAVKYASDYSDTSSSATCYDKLWLLSNAEASVKTNTATGYTGEGSAYTWSSKIYAANGCVKAFEVYIDKGEIKSTEGYWWTRSRNKNNVDQASRVNESGSVGGKKVSNESGGDNIGLAPGFVLARSSVEEPSYRYAVQLYGIGVDNVLSNDTTEAADGTTYVGGLTFGPAIGDDYTYKFQSHEPSGSTTGEHASDKAAHEHRCIHTDSWETIIENNKVDPYIYEQCIENHCTKAVPLDLNENNSADGVDTSKVFNTAAGNKYTGDGVGALFNEIQESSRHWGEHYEDGTEYFTRLNWSNSVIRAALNGSLNGTAYTQPMDTSQTTTTYGTTYSETNCILSAFPEALRNAIGRKAVQYATKYNTDTVGTSYDQLWLLSTKELYGHISDQHYYSLEGEQYSRTEGLQPTDGTKVYIGTGSSDETWLRSSYRSQSGRAALAFGDENKVDHSWVDGQHGTQTNRGYAISPCFTLYRDAVETEEQEGYRYAVQLYDICVDTISKDEGVTTSLGGLTFGPAIGESFVSADAANKGYKSHEPQEGDLTTARTLADGTSIAGGNQKRCIHNDTWKEIIDWNEIDPYVYEDCITNQCTKSIHLDLDENNSASTTDATKVYNTGSSVKVTGDGAGTLTSELQNVSRKWADSSAGAQNWGVSRIRAALNGYTYADGTYVMTNSYSDTNSVLSAFPKELQQAIAHKAVVYTTNEQDKSSTATTYDQLWLLSTSELYGDLGSYAAWIYPAEGRQYARAKALAIGSSQLGYAYNASGGVLWSWTRSLYRDNTNNASVSYNYNDGQGKKRAVDQCSVTDQIHGVAPGFTLSRAASDHSHIVQLPVTGGAGRNALYIASLALALTALTLLALAHRRRAVR